MRDNFDPMTQVPNTDEEVEICLRHEKPEGVGQELISIYRTRRQQGQTVHGAYEGTLIAHVEAAGLGHLLKKGGKQNV